MPVSGSAARCAVFEPCERFALSEALWGKKNVGSVDQSDSHGPRSMSGSWICRIECC